jgi:DNA invertase Pin-like site-specific DNA recombinase
MAGAILAVSSGVSRFGGCVTIGPNVGVWKNPSEIESRDINKTEHFEQPNLCTKKRLIFLTYCGILPSVKREGLGHEARRSLPSRQHAGPDHGQSGTRAARDRRSHCEIVKVYRDHGISGAKGRDKRPGFDALCRDATKRQFDVIMAWSVDRLGRSLQDLVGFLSELHALGIDLFLHQQGLDTTTPAGKAMFQMMGVFAEFERAMIQERVRAGLARAKSEGKRLGRPRIASELEERIRKALATPGRPGVRKIAERFGVDPGTVQRISRPRPFADGAASVLV